LSGHGTRGAATGTWAALQQLGSASGIASSVLSSKNVLNMLSVLGLGQLGQGGLTLDSAGR
jgi:hypothetical protein